MIKTWKLDIKGMTCDSCAAHVAKSLKSFTGMKDGINIDWKSGTGTISSEGDLDTDSMKKSLRKAGYSLETVTLQNENPGTSPESRRKTSGNADYNLIIIGGGSAAFAAAIQASELGKTAVMVEQSTMGGTCVNIGCVPSKFLIHRSTLDNPGNWPSDMAALVDGMRGKKYKEVLDSYSASVSYISGRAEIVDSRSVQLEDGKLITGDALLIAAGSHTVLPDIPGAEGTEILDSEALLALPSPPESLIVLGGRFVALELGQAFSRLGTKVTILQRSDRLIPNHEREVSQSIQQKLEASGIEVITGISLKSIEENREKNRKTVIFTQNGNESRRSGTAILSALGRRGNSEGLNLQALGIELDSSGRIITDSSRQAGNSGIYAAGDIVASPSLVYVAAKEGKIAAINALNTGNNTGIERISLDIVPDVIFTSPQVAKVGLTEAEAGARGLSVEKSAFPYSETPNAGVNEVTAGVIVLIRDAESHKLLGGDIVAPNAGDIIQTLTIAIEAGWTSERLQDVLFPYLTGVEGLKLAAITFSKDVAKLSCCAV